MRQREGSASSCSPRAWAEAGRGGAGQIIVSTLPHVRPAAYEHEVAYVLPHKDALVGALTRQHVTVYDLGGGRLRWVLNLRRLLRNGRYDLVHTHMPIAAAAARALAPRRTAFGHTEHNLWQRYHPVTGG